MMRNFFARHRGSAGAKLFVFALSLAVCLLLLEAGLRLAGGFVESGRERAFIPERDAHDADFTFERYRKGGEAGGLILTLGDSLINGNNVPSRHSFPFYLYRSLADAGVSAAVYNLGKCEESTLGVSAKLENYLKTAAPEETPDAVVILVGAADLFNLPLARERVQADGSVWHDVFPRGLLYRSRVYKVLRHILTAARLSRNGGGGDPGPSTEEKFKLLRGVYEEQKKGGALEIRPELKARLEGTFGEEARRYRLDLGRLEDVSELLSDYAGRVYSPHLRYDDFFALLLDMASAYPLPFWTGEFDAANFHFVQIYPFQSKFTAEAVLAELDSAARAHPRLEESEGFRSFRKWLTDRDEMDRLVERERLEAWERIIRLARDKGVRVILQNYPADYRGANAVLAKVASEHGLPLLDNRTLFGRLSAEGGRGKYLEDNDHMTPEGNRVMAENVSGLLLKEVFLRR